MKGRLFAAAAAMALGAAALVPAGTAQAPGARAVSTGAQSPGPGPLVSMPASAWAVQNRRWSALRRGGAGGYSTRTGSHKQNRRKLLAARRRK